MEERAIPWRLEVHHNEKGSLIALEGNRDVPFVINRVFYVYGTPEGITRGGHAHRDCQQVIICVAGYCRIVANGDEFNMTDPTKALYVPPGVHIDLGDFTPGAVLLVLCSHHYEEEEYIHAVPEPDAAAQITTPA